MNQPRGKETARRTRRLIVRLTDEERVAIQTNAQKAALRLSEYVRRVAVNGHIIHVQETGYGMSLAFQLRKVGVNLNQLAHVANAEGELPPELESVLRKIETLLDRILRTM